MYIGSPKATFGGVTVLSLPRKECRVQGGHSLRAAVGHSTPIASRLRIPVQSLIPTECGRQKGKRCNMQQKHIAVGPL